MHIMGMENIMESLNRAANQTANITNSTKWFPDGKSAKMQPIKNLIKEQWEGLTRLILMMMMMIL